MGRLSEVFHAINNPASLFDGTFRPSHLGWRELQKLSYWARSGKARRKPYNPKKWSEMTVEELEKEAFRIMTTGGDAASLAEELRKRYLQCTKNP